MQSDSGQNQTIQPSSSGNANAGASAGTRPQAKDILQNLDRSATDPLEFIRKNLEAKGVIEKPSLDPQRVSDEINAKVSIDPPKEIPKEIPKETPKEAPKPLDIPEPTFGDEPAKPELEQPVEEPEPSDIPEEARSSFKKLRTKFRVTSESLRAKEVELETTKKKLNEYETGAAVAPVLRDQEERLAKLERYEQLYNLKGSPAYKDKFIAPLAEKQTKLKAIADDYGVPVEVLGQAVNLQNRAELNRFLAEHNFDDIGAAEVRSLFTDIRGLQTEARAAEEAPLRVLAELEEEHTRTRQAHDAARVSGIRSAARSAWLEAVGQVRAEGKAQELIMTDDNPERNEKIVKPILGQAATEYGKIVSMLGELGLEKLPKPLAEALSKMSLLAHASAVSIESRDSLARETQELRNALDRNTRFNRPAIGGGVGRSGASDEGGAPTPLTPQEAAKMLTQSILRK